MAGARAKGPVLLKCPAREPQVGAGHTEVAALGALMTSCPTCKKTNWTAEVLYVDPGTMGWKALGEKSLDSIPARAAP